MSSMIGWGPTGKSSGLSKTGYKQIVSPTMNQNQMQLTQMLHSLLGQGGFGQGLSDLSAMAGGDQSKFAQLEAPAMRQFGALQGNLASRFSGMGSGARNSSGFQNTMGEAGADLAERLQGQRMGLQQQALAQLMGLSESLLNRKTFESGLVPKQMPFWKQLLLSLGTLTSDLAKEGGKLGIAHGLGAF